MKKILICFIILLFVSLPVFSFQFEPIIQDFSPSGINSRRNFFINNTSDKPIAVKVSMTYRDVDLFGIETLTDASDVFFVFPSQVIVQPASNQTVRVQWLGDSAVSIEQPFRIIAEQLPINMNQEQSGVNILIAYHGSIYVIPEEFSFGIEITSVQKVKNEEGNDVLQIELENTGNTHIILDDPVIHISNTSLLFINREFILTDDELIGLDNQNILAGKNRVFTVPCPDGLSNGNINATLILDTKR
ncbi:MAG: fimbria/pilus periplasmic chaperone [Bacteroidetes bacterium]|nr:fimbria/pilus periplasmic chaperone [Bacteroidota bacterium]